LVAFSCLGALCAAPAAAQQPSEVLPQISVTSSRLGDGITGASTTVITAEELARSPGQTLQDVLATQPGIQIQSLYGPSAGGARDVIDMRGFGAAATSNTLVLVNGRRLNDAELASVDLAAIPRDSIERIEIIRGNAGSVLYGEGAVGGTINIITKTGVGLPNRLSAQQTVGSYGYHGSDLSMRHSNGPFTVSAYGSTIDSKGYRVNNELRERNGVGEIRYTGVEGTAYLNMTADSQHVGLPGGRNVTLTTSVLAADRRGAATPWDYSDKQSASVTTGFTRQLNGWAELIVDGGVRQKQVQGEFFFALDSPYSYVDTSLSVWSFTPRVKLTGDVFGMATNGTVGVDVYKTDYQSDRSSGFGLSPIHRYGIDQRTLAAYWQHTVSVRPDTDISAGARLQRNTISARDIYDPTAPGAFDVEGLPLDKNENQHAYHVGIEHRLNAAFAVFGRIGRSFRFPNADERIGMAPFLVASSLDLKTQTSHDIEGGVRFRHGAFDLQTSAYVMDLTNEIHFSPATFTNTNLDPTRRSGVESQASYRVSDTLRLKGGLAYTRAVFREGVNAGHEVPLVSRWTGSAGVSWDVWAKWLTLDVTARFFGDRRFDNDQANFQPKIPGTAVVDLRLGGEIDRFNWSMTVQNLFDTDYFDYGIASATTYGTYNAYPQPGRTFMAKAGVTF
jgi:iron complex outermembrane receptor protein